jgi:hypothetical protein
MRSDWLEKGSVLSLLLRAALDGQDDKLRGEGPGELRPSPKLGHRVKTATVG